MKERRSLAEGVDPSLEREYVFGKKPKSPQTPEADASTPASDTAEGKGQAGNPVSRLPLTTRVRADFAAALKRASLQRQLNGVRPNTLQDILEEALEPWLRSNGYLS